MFDVLLFDVLILAACRSRLKRGVLLFVINFAVKYNQYHDTTEVLPPPVDRKIRKIAFSEQRTQNTH